MGDTVEELGLLRGFVPSKPVVNGGGGGENRVATIERGPEDLKDYRGTLVSEPLKSPAGVDNTEGSPTEGRREVQPLF